MYKFVKRILDIIISLIGLVVLSPLLIIVIIILVATSHKNPFFIQKRSGIYGNEINVIKLKTMNEKKDLNGNLLHDKYRLTKIGKL